MGYDDPTVGPLLQHADRTELDAQSAAFAPVGEHGYATARQPAFRLDFFLLLLNVVINFDGISLSHPSV